MITYKKIEEAKIIIEKCCNCINNGNINSLASYEEGVKDALNWILYDDMKPIIEEL